MGGVESNIIIQRKKEIVKALPMPAMVASYALA
jgi:hypothetical protein